MIMYIDIKLNGRIKTAKVLKMNGSSLTLEVNNEIFFAHKNIINKIIKGNYEDSVVVTKEIDGNVTNWLSLLTWNSF